MPVASGEGLNGDLLPKSHRPQAFGMQNGPSETKRGERLVAQDCLFWRLSLIDHRSLQKIQHGSQRPQDLVMQSIRRTLRLLVNSARSSFFFWIFSRTFFGLDLQCDLRRTWALILKQLPKG